MIYRKETLAFDFSYGILDTASNGEVVYIYSSAYGEPDQSSGTRILPLYFALTRCKVNGTETKTIYNYEETIYGFDEINRENCFLSFDNMQSNLKMIGLKVDGKYKPFINELYGRRNKIAHQSDRIPGSAEKCVIKEADVKNYIKKVKEIVSSIDEQVKENNKR